MVSKDSQLVTTHRGFPVVRRTAQLCCQAVRVDSAIVFSKRDEAYTPVAGFGIAPAHHDEQVRYLLSLCGKSVIANRSPDGANDLPNGIGFVAMLPLTTSNGEEIGALGLLNAAEVRLTGRRKQALDSSLGLVAELLSFRAPRWLEAPALERKTPPQPQYHPDGSIHWSSALLDYAAQRLAAEVVAESEERLRLTVEKSLDAIVSMNHRGTITSWNPQAETIFGWTAEEAIGRHLVDLTLAPGMDEAEHEFFFRSLTHPEALDRRVVIRAFRRDGKPFPMEFAWTTLGHGANLSYISFLRDISEQVRTQTELHAIYEEAERANRIKSEFLSQLSHELRTPLNSVIGFGQLLLTNDLEADSRDYAENILQAGSHLLELINEVLDLGSIEAGCLNVEMEQVDAGAIIREAITLVQPIAERRAVRMMRPIQAEGWWVQGDPRRLKQALINLLSNAAKYTRDHGMVAVNLKRSGETIHIEVEDDGPGIPPEKIDRLFVPFDRLGAEKSQIEGTGLGLPLTQKLAAAMGGEISVVSTVGTGTTFTLSLLASTRAEEAA